MLTEENMVPLATPTRFLIENGEWNLTPGLNIQPEMNPFDCNLNEMKNTDNHVATESWSSAQSNTTSPILYNTDALDTTTVHSTGSNNQLASPPTPPMTLSQSPSSTSTSFSVNEPQDEQQQHHYVYAQPQQRQQEQPSPQETIRRSSRIHSRPQQVYSDYNPAVSNNNDYVQTAQQPPQQRKPSTSGRKRRIVFEGEDAEDRRKKFLERNRIAAYKCRQKKKNWMQDLEQKAEIQNIQNERLRTMVAQLKEESMYLKNLLLTHGNCDCESVQAYLRKTSMEITNNTSSAALLTANDSYNTIRRDSTYSTSSYPTHITSNTSFTSTSTGLTPFLNTVINKPHMPKPDYFSHPHHHPTTQHQHILDNNNDVEA